MSELLSTCPTGPFEPSRCRWATFVATVVESYRTPETHTSTLHAIPYHTKPVWIKVIDGVVRNDGFVAF